MTDYDTFSNCSCKNYKHEPECAYSKDPRVEKLDATAQQIFETVWAKYCLNGETVPLDMLPKMQAEFEEALVAAGYRKPN